MAVKVPAGYTLEADVDKKVLRRAKYFPVTVGDLRDFIADLPEDAPVWLTRYDEESDDIFLRPLEQMGSSSDSSGRNGYVTL